MKRFIGVLLIVYLALICCAATTFAQQAAGRVSNNGDPSPCSKSDPTKVKKASKPVGTEWFLPQPPVYPSYENAEDVTEYAKCLSKAFESYVKAWMAGEKPATIPRKFLPPGTNFEDFPSFRLVSPDKISAEEQWAIRQAEEIDPRRLHSAFPDPNATYLVIPALYAPFGTKVVINGEFPHARYFSAQITPSFDRGNYRYDGGIGVGEVPIVDADIVPLKGNVNPFRVGANRQAKNRSYRLEFTMAIGDPVKLNKAFRPPHFRRRGNHRYGSGIMYQGPWGVDSDGHGRGSWDVGQLWLRYYAPDNDKGPLGGVKLPKVHFELPDGRKYYVQVDNAAFIERVNATQSSPTWQRAAEPGSVSKWAGHRDSGWFKQTGIFRAIITGIALNTNWAKRKYVRMLQRGVAGRGEKMGAPNNYEQSATSATHIDYLVRSMSREKGHVVVLSGKLPVFPPTRDGQKSMKKGQLRYFSIVGYHEPTGLETINYLLGKKEPGTAVHEVMDEEITIDKKRRYVIALSSPGDRPDNATKDNGVTWRDWGRFSTVSWTLRWMAIGPKWADQRITPSPANLGRSLDWASPQFDRKKWKNDNRALPQSDYIPRVHYLSKEQFENLGTRNLPLAFSRNKYWEK